MTSDLLDLSSYKPDYSAAKSGVSWESNRVQSMTLLRVRYYNGDTLLKTDSTQRKVIDNSDGGGTDTPPVAPTP